MHVYITAKIPKTKHLEIYAHILQQYIGIIEYSDQKRTNEHLLLFCSWAAWWKAFNTTATSNSTKQHA